MNRRGFILGAGALAAPSIIGISGVIQLSRPRLVAPTFVGMLQLLGIVVEPWQTEFIEAYRDAMIFGRGAMVIGSNGRMRRVHPFGAPDDATIIELPSVPLGTPLLP